MFGSSIWPRGDFSNGSTGRGAGRGCMTRGLGRSAGPVAPPGPERCGCRLWAANKAGSGRAPPADRNLAEHLSRRSGHPEGTMFFAANPLLALFAAQSLQPHCAGPGGATGPAELRKPLVAHSRPAPHPVDPFQKPLRGQMELPKKSLRTATCNAKVAQTRLLPRLLPLACWPRGGRCRGCRHI